MPYRALADLVLLAHAAFVAFVVLGGLVVLRRPAWAWIHAPAALWGIFVEYTGLACPLTRYLLAHANVARMRAPLDDPLMAGFVAQLNRINALADRSRGFVWRLQTDDGNATGIRAYDDERILFNMSVWESIEDLHGYV